MPNKIADKKMGNIYLKKKCIDTAILIVDVQEKLVKAIKNKEQIVWNIKRLVDASDILGVKRYYSEQNPNKLGQTLPELNCNEFKKIEKMRFSCSESKVLLGHLEEDRISNILVCGVESHVCVQQTSLDMITKGYNICIAVDAIGSRNSLDHEIALKRLESAGCILGTTESFIFEWCETADCVEFKDISKLIKKEIS